MSLLNNWAHYNAKADSRERSGYFFDAYKAREMAEKIFGKLALRDMEGCGTGTVDVGNRQWHSEHGSAPGRGENGPTFDAYGYPIELYPYNPSPTNPDLQDPSAP